jgi:hypothetical protein
MSCRKINTDCKNSSVVKAVKKIINQLESDNITDLIPITKKEIRQIKRALDLYKKECRICARETGNYYKCLEAAAQNLYRRIPMFSKNIYPWKNYDWDYSNYIANNYSVEATGAKVGNRISHLYRNLNALSKVIGGLIDDPIPNKKSVAARYSRNSDYPKFSECGTKCHGTEKVDNALGRQLYRPPTTDSFLRKKLHGKYSSSYFVKIGSCPRRDIVTMRECQRKGYTWSPNIADRIMKKMQKNKNVVRNESGSCSQPRYLFIDNSAKPFINGSNMQGMIPSIANDILSLSPDKLVNAAMGKSMTGNFEIQQCPTSGIEGFKNINKKTDYVTLILILLLILTYLFLKK